MKSQIVFATLSLAAIAAHAQTPPPPPVQDVAWSQAQVPTGDKEVSYIGVATMPVPPPLTAQLKLKPGFGLLVGQVVENSPAAAAGLKENDILVKLDDQQLVDPNQLMTLVRSYTPGSDLTMTYISEGETKTAKLTVGKRQASAELMPTMQFRAGPDVMMFQKNPVAGLQGQGSMEPEIQSLVLGLAGTPASSLPVSRTVISENNKRYELLSIGDKEDLVVTGEDGREIFRGPVNNEKDLSRIPEEAKPIVKRMKAIRIKVPPMPGGAGAAPQAAVKPAEFRVKPL
jgi:membrane-associated protease RseP (regulator of RpoE activity)